MNERERLIELIMDAPFGKRAFGERWSEETAEPIADYLLSQGVTVSEEVEELKADNRRLREMWAKAVSDLSKADASLIKATRWIPVTERLPDIVETKRSYGNVYRSSGRVLCACLQADGKRMVKEGYMKMINDAPNPKWKIPGTIHSVTHWMPLPEPPKEEA